MAALMRHGALENGHWRTTALTAPRQPLFRASAGFATKAEKKKGTDRKQPPRIDSTARSIAAKGFLRPQNDYKPPENVAEKLERIFEEVAGATGGDASVGNLEEKFRLCSACAKEFDHPIPNSVLHTVQTLNDVRKFYQTPVDTVTPLDKMRNMELPENLHVQFEYHRFHPDTDTKFGGQTAFNRSSTIVTGLKYKGKYKGHEQRQEWPFNS